MIGAQYSTCDGLTITLPFEDGLVGNPKIRALHGGVTDGMLESTAILKLLWARHSVDLPKIIGITIEYLRSSRPIDTFARAIEMAGSDSPRLENHGRGHNGRCT